MISKDLTLNILTFNPPVTEKEFSFITERKPGFYPIKKDEFPVNIEEVISVEELEQTKCLYTDFATNPEGSVILNVDLIKSTRFAKHYYAWLILNHFREIADIVECDFINDLIVWFKDNRFNDPRFDHYQLFRLRVQMKRVSEFPELVIAYHTHTRVFKKSIALLDYDVNFYKRVVYNKQVYRKKFQPENSRNELEKVFPVLNNNLKNAIGIKDTTDPKKNCYKEFYDLISEIVEKYINTEAFRKIIPINCNSFISCDLQKILNTTSGSNNLVFAQGRTHISPKYEIGNGVCEFPPNDKTIEIFFIYNLEFESKAIELYKYLKGYLPASKYDKRINEIKGKPNYLGLQTYIGTQFNCIKENHIRYSDRQNPAKEVIDEISRRKFDTNNTRYLAIYISPVNKISADEITSNAYYSIKESLLNHGITSQAIYFENIKTSGMDYTLQNIFVALCAKLGGVPWRLNSPVSNELIIGVGAFKSTKFDTRYIGSAFCFSNNGHFKNFNAFNEEKMDKIPSLIKEAIEQFKTENQNVSRLVIHFYKKMKWRDIKPIQDMLRSLNYKIPIIVVTINKTLSNDYLMFDTGFYGKMPISGTSLQIGKHSYILCNNTRYTENSKIESFPFPIKLSFWASEEEILTKATTQILINQVYQFSRMY